MTPPRRILHKDGFITIKLGPNIITGTRADLDAMAVQIFKAMSGDFTEDHVSSPPEPQRPPIDYLNF